MNSKYHNSALIPLLSIIILLNTAISCGNTSSNNKQIETQSENSVITKTETNILTIGKWTTIEGQTESYITLTYNKDEKTYYIHDVMNNASTTLYDSTKPVIVKMVNDGSYDITYVQKWDDHYKLNSRTGALYWYCKGYNDVIMNVLKYSIDTLNKSYEDYSN